MDQYDAKVLVNGRVLVDGELREGLAVFVRDGVIDEILPAETIGRRPAEPGDLAGKWLLPGFIDVQVNGGGGVLFNDEPTVEGITEIAAAHRKLGTTGLLPTLISDHLEVVHRGLAAVRAAIKQRIPGVLGIHIEGPFLNPERRGVHDPQRICRLQWEAIDELEPLDNGRTLMTLAPDQVERGMIRKLVDKGFIICAGHSNATYAQVMAAVDEGMRGFTHLYNAMSPLTARAPGVVGAALALKDTWCGIIADGYHVSPASLKIALQCKGRDRLMLVTDAMPNAGTDLGEFNLQGKRITVAEGILRDESGTLAGAALDLGAAVRNIMAMTACSLADAIAMASATPAAFLGMADQRGVISPGRRADLVVASPGLNVVSTVIGGSLY